MILIKSNSRCSYSPKGGLKRGFQVPPRGDLGCQMERDKKNGKFDLIKTLWKQPTSTENLSRKMKLR
jgi:hypothetical protein